MDGVDESLPVPAPADVAAVLRATAAALETGSAAALATVLARHGSTPSTPGQKLALTPAGCFGTVGGGAVEAAVLRSLVDVLRAAAAGVGSGRTESFRLGAEPEDLDASEHHDHEHFGPSAPLRATPGLHVAC